MFLQIVHVAFLEGIDLALSGVLCLLIVVVSEDSCEEILGAVFGKNPVDYLTTLCFGVEDF